MMAPTSIAEQLKRDEGFRAKPYGDTRGNLTIGYGRNLAAVGVSEPEAEALLANDIAGAEQKLAAALPWTSRLDRIRFAVLVNMAFNMGIRGLLSFGHALERVQAGDYQAAASAMLQSEWAAEVGDRATRLAQQMLTGEWV